MSDFPTSIQLTELLHLYNIEIANLSYWSEVVSRLCSFFVDICRTLSSREPVTPIVVLDLCIYSSKSSRWCTITSNIQNTQCHMHNFQRFIKYMLIIVCLTRNDHHLYLVSDTSCWAIPCCSESWRRFPWMELGDDQHESVPKSALESVYSHLHNRGRKSTNGHLNIQNILHSHQTTKWTHQVPALCIFASGAASTTQSIKFNSTEVIWDVSSPKKHTQMRFFDHDTPTSCQMESNAELMTLSLILALGVIGGYPILLLLGVSCFLSLELSSYL